MYKYGQFVRALNGKPARAIGNGTECVYKADDGVLQIDTIQRPDSTITYRECPTLRELENFLKEVKSIIKDLESADECPATKSA